MISNSPSAAPNEPTTIEKMRGLRWGILGDSANTVFVEFTFFGSVFILFLNTLGLSKVDIGLILSFFPFAGLIAPFIAPRVAQFGYKRTFLTFWMIRKGFTLFLLATPWLYARFGAPTAVVFVATIVALFSLCRAIAETGKYPWSQEYIPNHIRGKYSALDNLCVTLVGLGAVAVAGGVIEYSHGLTGFMSLIGIGVLFGLVAVWAYAHVPGGTAVANPAQSGQRDLRTAVADTNLRYYLLGIALMTLATVPLTSFLPLFMQEEVGLRNSQVILLQNGTLIGGLMFVFIWGWAADRYGSTPVMLSGVLLRVILPIFWLIMPQNDPASLYVALGIAFLQGVANMGWGIGSARLLFVSVVPPSKKSDYMALYYAWIGLIGGLSQLMGGWLLDHSRQFSGSWWWLEINAYTPLFLLGLTLPIVSLFFLRRVQTDSNISVGTFAGFFFHGNPFMAVETMIRYHMAKDEPTAVRLTERLGQAKSHLTLEELLTALEDPRFNVRFEAIVAIGRTRPDQRLIEALAAVLHGNDPALAVIAAWALGRIHDPRARDTLFAGLDSSYRSIRGHSARSLGTLGDKTVVPTLLERLQQEPDSGLRIAYASALGQLQANTAVIPILQLLAHEAAPMARQELALALARLVGEEHRYVYLSRQMLTDAGTALAQLLASIEKRWSNDTATGWLRPCQQTFSQGKIDEGFYRLARFLRQIRVEDIPAPHAALLQQCAQQLENLGTDRPEYGLLALHLLETYAKQPPLDYENTAQK